MSTLPKYSSEVPDGMSVKARSAIAELLAIARAGWFPLLISTAHVSANGVRKAFGGQVAIPPTVDAGRAWLVFIDLNPHAEWSHRCAYYFVDDEGKVSARHDDTYPPSQE